MPIARLIMLMCAVAAAMSATAQIVAPPSEVYDADSLRCAFDNQPYFGLYKDNYFIFGPSVGPKANRRNTNIKFQISVAQRLTRHVLPFHSYLYLFYTQKCIWNVCENSCPMRDLNFNPGIGLAKPLFVKGRFVGKVCLMLEHESNGRDSIQSRSWNRLSVAANVLVLPQLMVYAKTWIPWVDGEYNRDLLDYNGIGQFGASYTTLDRKFQATVMFTKRANWKVFDLNTVVELSYKVRRNENQYLFLQFYNGYGENLLDYNCFRSQIRVGFVIKPRFFSDY